METNRLSVKAAAITVALLWGGALFIMASLNLFQPSYGQMFLQLMTSVYPAYDGLARVKSALVLGGLGLFDGVLLGTAGALIYNLCLDHKK